MFQINNLSFSWSGHEVTYEHNLQSRAGQITAIVGPSGVGKSTLLDLIAGYLSPSTGTIMLDGKNLVPLPPEQRPVSILFQSDNLFDHLSVDANLALGLTGGIQNKAQQIKNALTKVGLAGYAKRRSAKLSGGQKQRVALARTLLRNQPILLLDEPFANLDKQNAQNMRDLVLELTKNQNWHTLIVSHQPDEMNGWASQIYNMEHR